MKKLLSLGLVGVLLTGCATSKTQTKIIVGTEGVYPPYSYYDNSKLTGFDVDLISAILKKAGIDYEIQEGKWDSLIAGLDAKKYDLIANEVTITPERQEKYLFSDIYAYSYSAVLTTHANKNKVKSLSDIKGKKFSQTATSNHTKLAQDSGADIVTTNGWDQSSSLVMQGRTFGTIIDTLTYYDFKSKKPNSDLVLAYQDTKTPLTQGFLFRKNDKDLQEKVNKAMKELRDEGKLKQISEKYFKKDVTVK